MFAIEIPKNTNMKATITISIMILFLMAGCGQENKQSIDNFITIDVSKNYPKKELILQDFLDVEYIPLETSEEFITLGNVETIGKNIIVVRNANLRAGAGDIFIFKKNGKGLRKINCKGQGNGEYAFITDVTLDEEDGELYVGCLFQQKVFVYDLEGNFKRNFKYKEGPLELSIIYKPMYRFGPDHLICYDNNSSRNYSDNTRDVDLEPRNIHFIISKQDGSITKEIPIPFEKKISQILFTPKEVGLIRNEGIIPYHDGWLLVEPSADTIYSYSVNHELKPFIARTPSVQSMNPKVFLYPGVITDRYCFMQGIKQEYNENDETDSKGFLVRFNWVYDKKERKPYEYTVYNSDFTNKRPIKNLTYALNTLTVVNNDEIAFAERIEASELIEAYEAGKLQSKLKEIAAGLHEESNPVIMLAKYKKVE